MARRIFSREFKVEAVRLVKERGVTVAQACRDLDVHENVLRRWVRELTVDPAQATTPRWSTTRRSAAC
jgi:transposase